MAWFAFYVLRGSDAGAGAGGRGTPGFGGPGTTPSLTGSVLRVRCGGVLHTQHAAHRAVASHQKLLPAAVQVPAPPLISSVSTAATRWSNIQLRILKRAFRSVAALRLVSAQAAGSLRLPRHGDAEPHRNPFLQLLHAYLDAYLPRPGATPAAGGADARVRQALGCGHHVAPAGQGSE